MTGLARSIVLIAACGALAGCASSAASGLPSVGTPVPTVVPSVATSVAPAASAEAGLCGPIPTSNGKDALLPWGAYTSGKRTFSELTKRLVAAGLPDAVGTLAQRRFNALTAAASTVTFCFVDGEWAQYEGHNDDALAVGSFGMYTLVDHDTIRLVEPCCGANTVDFKIDDNTLTLSDWTPEGPVDGFDKIVMTGFTLFPYTLQP